MSDFQYIQFLRFSFQLLFPTAFFLIGRKRRKYFLIRLAGFFGVYLSSFYGFIELFKRFPSNLSELSSILYYILLFSCVLFGIYLCFDRTWPEVLFAGTGGYALENLTFNIVGVFISLRNKYSPGSLDSLPEALYDFLIRFLPYRVVGFLADMTFIRKNRKQGLAKSDFRITLISLVLLFTVVVLSVYSWVNIPNQQVRFRVRRLFKGYSIVCCVSILWLLYTVSTVYLAKVEQKTREYRIGQEKKQHDLRKENIEIINIKCHDLKKQIQTLKANPSLVDQDEIKKLENKIQEYEHAVRTGNEALDVILTEESFRCFREGIKLSLNIVPDRLSFRKKADIVSLFENRVDNAREAIQRDSEEQKEIKLSIIGHDNLTAIVCSNPYHGKLKKEGNLYRTSKANAQRHGFGLKSIEYIVKRYNGTRTIQTENNRFTMKILFGSAAFEGKEQK